MIDGLVGVGEGIAAGHGCTRAKTSPMAIVSLAEISKAFFCSPFQDFDESRSSWGKQLAVLSRNPS